MAREIRVETIHYFLKRYIERMNAPAYNEELERRIAEYERTLREQLLRDHELAALAAKQRSRAKSRRLLPMAGANEREPDLQATA